MRSVRLGTSMLAIVLVALIAFANTAVETRASETTVPLYGPETFERDRGQPVAEIREIDVQGFGPPFTLYVQNGTASGGNIAAGGRIMLDGELVLGPRDIAPRRPATYEVPIEIGETALLSVQVDGAPGSQMTVWIEGVPDEDPTELFFTVWEDGQGGQIERLHAAKLGIPVELDVDDISGADLIGAIDLGPGGELVVTVERIPGVPPPDPGDPGDPDESGPLPVLVKAIVHTPDGAREWIELGYDQRGENAPEHFSATLALDTHLGVAFEQQGPGHITRLIAGLFDGTPEDRGESDSLRVQYQVSPSESTVNAPWTLAGELKLAADAVGPMSVEYERQGLHALSSDIQIELTPGAPLQFTFQNTGNLALFKLDAVGPTKNAQVTLVNLPRLLSLCIDSGPACQRPNPHSVQRYSGENAVVSSLDFDDFGTHGSGSGPAFRTTMNANVHLGGDPVIVTNLRFRNLSLDLVDANNPDTANCGTMPRMSLFVDSRSHPFAISSLTLPAVIEEIRLGTDSNPARASNRIHRINGWSTGFFGCLGGPSRSHAGGMTCGGQQMFMARTDLGTINLQNYLAFQPLVPCGGTVPNPQPW